MLNSLPQPSTLTVSLLSQECLNAGYKDPCLESLADNSVFRFNAGKIGNRCNSMILNSYTSCIGTKVCVVPPSSHLAGERIIEFHSPLFNILTIRRGNKHKHMMSF